MLKQKLAAVEKKIIVGGENLLEKAEEQEKLLEESAKELEERKEKEEELRKALEEKEVGKKIWLSMLMLQFKACSEIGWCMRIMLPCWVSHQGACLSADHTLSYRTRNVLRFKVYT